MNRRQFVGMNGRTALLFSMLLMMNCMGLQIPENLQRENLVAWCIVPFDASKRTPEERAKMLKELGLTKCAYDWRKEHVAEFEEEIIQYQQHGIEFFAFWGEHPKAFALFRKHDLHPQIWKMFGDPKGETQEEKVINAVKSLLDLAKRTAELKCLLSLYNHGGWSGEPKNLVAVCRRLHAMGYKHVGIVYNWHHGHGGIGNWEESFALMKPYLHCLNLNGMKTGADPKILPLGLGDHEAAMLRVVIESGYDGPVGILDHRNDVDAKIALEANLNGLKKLLEKSGKETE